jgi:hypothetical protein
LIGRNSKSQITNPKQAPNSNHQIFKTGSFGDWKIRIYSEFGAWDLVLITITFKEGEQLIGEKARGR